MRDYVVPELSHGPVTNRLKNKVAFVTGTASGQGREVALLFGRAGARVLGADIKGSENEETARLAQSEGLTFIPSLVDTAEEAATLAWIDAGVAQFGRIDVLYNNAGFAHFAPVEVLTQAQWTETLKYELDVIFNPSRFAWPHMKRQCGGSIINVASVSGMLATPLLPGIAHAAGKGGVLGVTRQLSLEGAPYGIRVNSISPGPIVTATTKPVLDADPTFRAAFEGWPSLARPGQPEDVAYAALFLASDEAAWITGINLPVDGGMSSKAGARA
jgi:meso-butanediol dehydrogenase/(S,S)-butanediol dehydrogenase/diacetyl reductase